ncbi:MAG: peroxiredoxin family protein [Planctomycetes bacterium]|nr:peroxiredoxin family protein [Planctomycetota bacterium]
MQLLPLLLFLPLAQEPAETEEIDEVLEGHSVHGQSFNEGPRQAAYLLETQANVSFPVTAESPEVQAFFNQGVSFLHGFWYFEAERTFRHIRSLDETCTMALWGMAMANVDNQDRAADFARRAWLERDSVTERERMYIDSLAAFYEVEGEETPKRFQELDEKEEKEETEARKKRRKDRAKDLIKAYSDIIWEFPDDLEAKAFSVNRLWLNDGLGVKISGRQANEAILQQVLTEKPDHPAHHYRIHLWDQDENAKRVVDSAIAIGPSMPTVAHMWHMSGHIFSRLGRHSDAAWQQEASARVDHAHMMRDWVLPDQIHNFAHNNEWLTRSLRHHARVEESVSLAKNMIELPRHPDYNTLDRGSANYGRRRLLETLSLYEQWQALVELTDTHYLDVSDEPKDRADRAHRLAKSHAYLGNWESFEIERLALEEALAEAKSDRVTEMEEAEDGVREEGGDRKKIHEAMSDVLDEYQPTLDDIHDQLESLDALRKVLTHEEVDENLELLKERGFEKAHLALLYIGAGEGEKAEEVAREAAKDKEGRIYPNATLPHILYLSRKTEEALELFDELRPWTSRADLSLPALARLAPLAAERGLSEDWRPEVQRAEDIPAEARPELDSLGPVRWTPIAAPEWKHPDGLGGELALSDYRGRPVIVILFLGFGCVHCVEQLAAFTPAYDEFADRGIDMVAIGTDTPEVLAAGVGEDGEEPYPFPLAADPELELFKSWRAYDDFEDVPLHGTYLIDGAGRVRWLDISFEPFMDWEFLLEESVRLLGLPEPTPYHSRADIEPK